MKLHKTNIISIIQYSLVELRSISPSFAVKEPFAMWPAAPVWWGLFCRPALLSIFWQCLFCLLPNFQTWLTSWLAYVWYFLPVHRGKPRHFFFPHVCFWLIRPAWTNPFAPAASRLKAGLFLWISFIALIVLIEWLGKWKWKLQLSFRSYYS